MHHVCLIYSYLRPATLQGENRVVCSRDSNGNHELCSSVGGRGAGRGREGLLQDEEETHSGFEEEQINRWSHFKSGKEGRAVGAVVNL